jgi:hypothetical protein
MLNGTSPSNECAIYLHHTSGVHYNVVLNVSGILSNKTTGTLYVSKTQQKKEKTVLKVMSVLSPD